MRLPASRGPLSGLVATLLAGDGPPDVPAAVMAEMRSVRDPLRSGDFQLALASCYELHYEGFVLDDGGSTDGLEWDPRVLACRQLLESRFEDALRAAVAPPRPGHPPVAEALKALVAADEGPGLSTYLLREATVEQFRDFLIQRSVYQLKEADPHTWQIPRLRGRAKEALVEIQADEYGGGQPGRSHAALFGQTMRALGLDDTYGAYWDVALPETLAAVNLMSWLGLHRRMRGAAIGHLAALEMTSTAPNRRYGNGLRRLGFGTEATAYFDEHVEADAVHEQIAVYDLCGSFVAAEPELAGDVLWGAAACLALDALASDALLATWSVGERGAA